MVKRQTRELALQDRTLDNDDSDRDDDDGNAARDRTAKAKEDTGLSRPLACPYYKRDKTKFKSQRSCQRPGFPSMRRLKEHLYRRHRLEEFGCPRCHVDFKNKLDLDAHLEADPPCEAQQRNPLTGLDQAQYSLLRSRKRGRGVKTVEDKWKELYKVLFPDTEKEDIPSPYYDTDSTKGDRPDDLEDMLSAVERSAQRELPQYLQQLRDAGQYLGRRDDEVDLEGFGQDIVRWTMERLRQSLPAARDQRRARLAESPVRSPGRDLAPEVWPEPQSSQDPEIPEQVRNTTNYDWYVTNHNWNSARGDLAGIGVGFEEQLEALDPNLFVAFDETEGPGDANGLQI